jgi:transcriptional regulator GlxA family with amidase domain
MDVRVQFVLALLEQNPSGEFDWAKLSDSVSLSESRLRHLFTLQTGIAPREYSLRLRLERARALLSDERLTISQIGLRVGWQERSHFERRFKNYYGLSPAQYRTMVRRRLLEEKISAFDQNGHNVAAEDTQ